MYFFNITSIKQHLKNFVKLFRNDTLVVKSFYLYFSIIALGQFIPFEGVKVVFFLIATPFLLIKLFNTKYSLKEYIIYIIIGIVILISSFYSKREGLFITYVSLVGSKDIDFKKIVKIYLTIGLTVFSFFVLIALMDRKTINTTEAEIRYIFNIEIYVRKLTLGYSHANLTFALYYSLVLSYMYLKFNSLKRLDYIIITLSGLIFFYLTFSRTGLFILLFSMLFLNMINRTSSAKLISFYKWGPTIIVVFSFIITYLHKIFPNSYLELINKLLSDRIRLGHLFLDFFSPKLFGQYVDDIRGSNLWYLKCDNSYILTLCAYGILIFGMFLMITIFIPKLKLEKKDLFVLLIFYVYGFTESLFFNITFNFSLFLLYPLFLFPRGYEFSMIELIKDRVNTTNKINRGRINE